LEEKRRSERGEVCSKLKGLQASKIRNEEAGKGKRIKKGLRLGKGGKSMSKE